MLICSGFALLNLEFFAQLTLEIGQVPTCADLQALVNRAFGSLQAVISGIQAEINALTNVQILLQPPTSLQAIINWLTTFINGVLKVMLGPYEIYIQQLVDLGIEVAAFVEAIAEANLRFPEITIKVPDFNAKVDLNLLPLNLDWFFQVKARLVKIDVCAELQAFIDWLFGLLSCLKGVIQAEITELEALQELLQIPKSLPALITWIGQFITGVLVPLLKVPFEAYVQMLVQFEQQVAAMAKAVEQALERLTHCTIKIPNIDPSITIQKPSLTVSGAWFAALKARLPTFTTGVELQAFVDASFASMQKIKAQIEAEIAALENIQVLLQIPTSLQAVLQWFSNFIVGFLTPYLRPYEAYIEQLAQLGVEIAALVEEAQQIEQNIAHCKIEIPSI